MTSKTIEVLLAEDNYLMRLGTTTFINARPNMKVVAEAEDGPEAVRLYGETKPHVAVIDMRMPALDGAQVTAAILRHDPAAKVLILSHSGSEEDVFRAIQAGARGYVTKEARGEDLLEAIAAVSEGRRYLPAELAARVANRVAQPDLTVREREVLDLVFRGKANREIAVALGITARTAGFHVSTIMAKLGAKSRTEAVSIAIERGILS